jgi:hypothetical protein
MANPLSAILYQLFILALDGWQHLHPEPEEPE